MKYSDSNPPLVCMLTNSTCYKGTGTMQIKGVLWHSTGANNSWLKRYVQPSNNDPNYAQLMQLLGKNQYNNDFNHINRQAGLNCWIGKLANGTVTTVQTMPWNYRPWGCGSGSKGSCNTGWIQFEICEDGLNDASYFNQVYHEACEITAYLCKKYNIDPKGTTILNGVTVPTILCHADSYKLGLGSNHADIYHWFKKYNKDMVSARNDVTALIGVNSTPANPVILTPATPTSNIKTGDTVKIAANATYYTGKSIPDWVKAKNWIVKSVSENRAVIDKSADGKSSIMSAINVEYLTVVSNNAIEQSSTLTFNPYKIKVIANVLNVRKGPDITYDIAAIIYQSEVYTIIEEQNNWGKLKSGIGWISLKYTERVK